MIIFYYPCIYFILFFELWLATDAALSYMVAPWSL